jgi:translation initiation factor 2 beta subunit (eIF-2beta)/eIF-5
MEHKTLVTLRKKPFEFSINCSDILTNKDKYYLLNRSDQMYIQFMEKRLTKNSDEISQPQQVTIHHIANENNIERKIQLFVNFFTINDICSLYESQQNFINLSISETFISTLLDEANQFSLETKSNILNIFILLLPSNSIFLNSFLDCEFLFQFNQCLLKYINNFELLDSFFKCLINLLNNDTITTKVISNQLNLESYFEKVIMKLLDEQMIIQNKSKLIHQLLNVFPVLFYYVLIGLTQLAQ